MKHTPDVLALQSASCHYPNQPRVWSSKLVANFCHQGQGDRSDSPKFLHINRRLENQEYMPRVMHTHLFTVLTEVCVTIRATEPLAVNGLDTPVANG